MSISENQSQPSTPARGDAFHDGSSDGNSDERRWAGQLALADEEAPEWVADLFDATRAGDVEVAIAGLESLIAIMRKSAKARQILATLEPGLLRQGLQVSVTRRGTDPCH
jgi:hypothetical protein